MTVNFSRVGRVFESFLRGYEQSLATYPYRTQVATDFVARVSGDIIAQFIRYGGIANPKVFFTFPLLSAYYGWETPRVLHVIDQRIPNDTILGQLARPLAFLLLFSPLWTVRHQLLLFLIHGRPVDISIIESGLALWAGTAPFVFPAEVVIQNKIPLKFRFLAQRAVIFLWQIISSLIAIRH